MRTITVNICNYNELSDAAKKVAREWWIDLEAQDPGHLLEHNESRKAALHAVEHGTYAQVILDSANCVWTGYTDDALLADLCKQLGRMPSKREVEVYYEKAWDADLQSVLDDKDGIADTFEANEYEFTEDGKFYKA